MHHHVCSKGKLCKSIFSNGGVGCAPLQPLHCFKPSVHTYNRARRWMLCCSGPTLPAPAACFCGPEPFQGSYCREAVWIRRKMVRGKISYHHHVCRKEGFCGACCLPVGGGRGPPFPLLFQTVRGSRNTRRIMSSSCLQQRRVVWIILFARRGALGGCFPTNPRLFQANSNMKYHGCSDDLFATGGSLRLPSRLLLF